MATSAQAVGQDKPALRITRRYAVTPDKVWRAWTDPQALSRWFGPGDTECVLLAELDVHEGGSYHIRFQTADGEVHDVSGVYQRVVPDRALSFSWAWKSTPERVSRVSIELRPVDGGTELDFVHDMFFDLTARNNHERGWTGTFAKLDRFLEGES